MVHFFSQWQDTPRIIFCSSSLLLEVLSRVGPICLLMVSLCTAAKGRNRAGTLQKELFCPHFFFRSPKWYLLLLPPCGAAITGSSNFLQMWAEQPVGNFHTDASVGSWILSGWQGFSCCHWSTSARQQLLSLILLLLPFRQLHCDSTFVSLVGWFPFRALHCSFQNSM